jgi:hypothetical protein
VYVGGADVTGDGVAEIITGTNRAAGPLRVFQIPTPGSVTELTNFFPYFPAFLGPVRVAAVDLNRSLAARPGFLSPLMSAILNDARESRLRITGRPNQVSVQASPADYSPDPAAHFSTRTTKSGVGAAKPAVTAYNASPNSAMVVGTFVSGFDVKGSVMNRTTEPDR